MTAAVARRGGWDLLRPLAEVTLALVSLASVVGLHRVFLGGGWIGPLALHVGAAHLTLALLRRRDVSLAASSVVTAVIGAVVIGWVHLGDATTYGFPTADTFEVAGRRIGDAFGQFSEVKAPIEALDGFLIATAAAVWAGAILADWAAFRVHALLEPVLPSATLFTIGAIFGADRGRVAVAGLWIGAVLAFTLLRRADRLGSQSRWVSDEHGRGPRSLVVAGTVLLLIATGVAAVVGPRLPGARADALVQLTDLGSDGPGTRVTVSPLVDIRSRLVERPDVEVFQVRSDVRSYWRLTSLDAFDGRIWSSNGSYGKTSGGLDEGVPVLSERVVVTQEFQIEALAQIWLPAAYEPRRVEVADPVRYDEVSGTLIVDTDVPTSDGTRYGVVSALPYHRPELLRAAATAVPSVVADRYLSVPPDLPPRVAELASTVAAGSATAYDAALALQEFFRREFTYSLDVNPGHGSSAIESFLFESRSGYCEQFSGTFAAMARTLGIPARVAVGFTPGTTDPADPTLYRVRGEHAHAWPEVYLGEAGWVAFEPTPGRGAPLAEQYTGVPEQQVESSAPTSATTTPVPATVPAPTDVTVPDPSEVDPGGADFGTGDGDGSGSTSRWWWLLIGAAVLVAVVGTYAAVVVGWDAVRRARRRAEARTPSAQVSLAWDEALRSLRRVGITVPSSLTQRRAAAVVAGRFPDVGPATADLAAVVESAAFGPVAPEDEVGSAALALATRIDHVVTDSLSVRDRITDRLHPRRLRSR